MDNQSFEQRKNAPLHYLRRAENARYSAFCLFSTSESVAVNMACLSEYTGTPAIALQEAYRREAAIALELAVKAVIALRIQRGEYKLGIPISHDIPQLWSQAKLEKVKGTDKERLGQFKEIMVWLGKYPAPNRLEVLEKESCASVDISKFKGKKPISLDWEHFDRLYKIVDSKFNELYASRDSVPFKTYEGH